MPSPTSSLQPPAMTAWAEAINQALRRYSDKDWNYSRIFLETKPIHELVSPYVLGVDWVNTNTPEGRTEFKDSMNEIAWGERHSHELGMLEIASLRLNRALLAVTTADYWRGMRPVIRLQKRSELLAKGQALAFWYRVEEAQGEEFENR